jgi:D-alanyl-D-alanine carboxypeptidase
MPTFSGAAAPTRRAWGYARMFVLASLTALVVVAPPGTSAQPAGPESPAASQVSAETPATRQAKAFLEAATSGDQVRFLKFVADNAAATHIPMDVWPRIGASLTGLKLHAVLSATPTKADLLAYDGGLEIWLRLQVTVQDQPPYGITGLGLRQAKRPTDVAPPPKLAPPALAAAAKAKAEALAAADAFSGAVLIAKDGRPIFSAPFGLADRVARTPVTLATQFRFGSMGKMFTAVAILQLAEAGKVDLKAPIGRYLTDYPNAEIASKVTIENLLTHTGGTGDTFGPEFTAHRLTLKDARDYVALFGSRAPQFPPGTKQAYSNYGFMLLGRIVEVVSGMKYDDYLARRIFAPAHMTATGTQPETARLPDRAVGYMRAGADWKDAADTLPWRGTPAGGGYSTVGDMLAFANALRDHRLLGAAGLEKLTTGGLTGPDGTFFRYDFTDETLEGRRFWGHGGGAPGMNGMLMIFPDSGYTVVVLANRDPPVAQALADYIADRLP